MNVSALQASASVIAVGAVSPRAWLSIVGGTALLAAHAAFQWQASWNEGAAFWQQALSLAGAGAVLIGLAGMSHARRSERAGEEARRIAAAELERTAERLEMLFRFAPEALLLCTADGIIVDANETAEKLSGQSREVLRGLRLGEIVTLSAGTRDETVARAGELLQAETGKTYEYQVRRPDGRELWVEIEAQKFDTAEGAYVLISSRDVSERKNMEAQVREHETGLSLILNRLPIHIWTTDENLRVTLAQGTLFRSVGLDSENMIGRTLDEIFGDDPGKHDSIERHRQALSGGLIRYRRRWRGRVLEGAMSATSTGSEGGAEVIGVTLDVTEKEKAELEARSSELQLNEILDRAPVRVVIKDLNLRATYANLEAERISGLPRKDWIGKSAGDLVPPDVAERIEENDRMVLSDGRAQTFVEELRWNRQKRSFVTIRFPLYDANGKIYSLCSLASEITDRVQMEKELRRGAELLDQAQTMAHLASWEWDLRTGERQWSRQLYALLGLEPSIGPDASYEAYLGSILEEDKPMVMDAIKASVMDGRPYRMEHRIRRADGSVRWLLIQAGARRESEDIPWSLFGFVQDITDRKMAGEAVTRLNDELEDRVRQRAGELEYAIKELSSFSYAVSHDLRQPLRAIAGYVALLEEDSHAPLQGATRERLAQVRASVQRMDAMIRDLLALSRVSQAPVHRTAIDFSDLARDVAEELFAAEPIRRVDWEIAEGMMCYGDRGLVRIVLQNLLANALKFTRSNDSARIEVGMETIGKETWLFVSDDGAGFDADSALRLFQPFQRMHDASEFEGTGVGLATVARIVRRHGGTIRAESRKGHGARLCFTLPHSEAIGEQLALL